MNSLLIQFHLMLSTLYINNLLLVKWVIRYFFNRTCRVIRDAIGVLSRQNQLSLFPLLLVRTQANARTKSCMTLTYHQVIQQPFNGQTKGKTQNKGVELDCTFSQSRFVKIRRCLSNINLFLRRTRMLSFIYHYKLDYI